MPKTSFLLAVALTWCAAPLAAQSPEARDEAAALFQQSATEYREGRFAEAVELLRRAYALDPVPVLQYNLARALEGMGALEEAIAAYEEYLELQPDTRDRGAIEARLVTLERQLRDQRQLAAREAQPIARPEMVTPEVLPATPTEVTRTPNGLPWLVAAGGAVVLVSALVTGRYARATNENAIDAPSHAQTVELIRRADRLALASNIQLAAGGAAALVGIVWGIVDLAKSGSDDLEVTVGLGGASVRGRF